MELRAEHERVRSFGQLCDLHELSVLPATRENKACFLKPLDVFRIYFVPMAMTLRYLFLSVCLKCNRPFFEDARIRSEPHRSSVILSSELLALIRHDVYDRMRCCRIYLGRVRMCKTCNIARILDNHHLETIAKPEVRDFILACEPSGHYFPFNTRLSESAWNNDPIAL